MYGTPSYLSGIGESEPHYFDPTTPLELQPFVSNTPLDRGDGVRPVMLPAQEPSPIYHIEGKGNSMTAKRNFGAAPCVPCMTNPIALSGYGADEQAKQGLLAKGSGWWQSLTPEQQAEYREQALSVSCRVLGVGCPPEEAVNYVNTTSQGSSVPTWAWVVGGVTVLGLIGTVVVMANK